MTPAAPAAGPNAEAARAKPDAAPPAGDTGGRLLVRSTPAGALVFVDGIEHGPTPVRRARLLAPGGHRVRVVREDYAAAERRVVITACRSRPSR